LIVEFWKFIEMKLVKVVCTDDAINILRNYDWKIMHRTEKVPSCSNNRQGSAFLAQQQHRRLRHHQRLEYLDSLLNLLSVVTFALFRLYRILCLMSLALCFLWI